MGATSVCRALSSVAGRATAGAPRLQVVEAEVDPRLALAAEPDGDHVDAQRHHCGRDATGSHRHLLSGVRPGAAAAAASTRQPGFKAARAAQFANLATITAATTTGPAERRKGFDVAEE